MTELFSIGDFTFSMAIWMIWVMGIWIVIRVLTWVAITINTIRATIDKCAEIEKERINADRR